MIQPQFRAGETQTLTSRDAFTLALRRRNATFDLPTTLDTHTFSALHLTAGVVTLMTVPFEHYAGQSNFHPETLHGVVLFGDSFYVYSIGAGVHELKAGKNEHLLFVFI